MSTSGVTVVEERVVAGLTSTVLQATSPEALDAWLLEHGYRSSPELVSWMAPYVRDGWMLTAFRVDPGAAPRGRVSMGAIRMSFSVERPFFPYSEPQTAGREPRPFRVSVVAPFRMTASVGRAPWPVPVAYAQRSARLSSILTGIVPAEARTGPLWITTFDEPRSVRGTSDVTFDADTVTARVASRISREIVSFRR